MRKATRRTAIAGGLAVVGAAAAWHLTRKPPLGIELTPDLRARGERLLEEHPAVDVHAHPGRSFLAGADPDSLMIRLMRDGYEAERVADMAAGGVTAGVFAIVADLAVLGIEDGLRAVRAFAPGEAHADYRRQLARLTGLAEGGVLRIARTPADVRAATGSGTPVAVLASEGGDFIEGDLRRVAQAHAEGLRTISLMHYAPNALGDTQTGAEVHGGLSHEGRAVVREMNRLGLIVDAAHASYRTCIDIVAESRHPVLLSHSNLNTGPVRSPRFLSAEHARLIADTGGVIGAWPAGIGSESLADFADQVLALVNVVGAAHVAIGSDMDGNYKPVLTEYRDFPLLAAVLLAKGVNETDVAAVLGGNFLRLFDEVSAAAGPAPGEERDTGGEHDPPRDTGDVQT